MKLDSTSMDSWGSHFGWQLKSVILLEKVANSSNTKQDRRVNLLLKQSAEDTDLSALERLSLVAIAKPMSWV